MRKIKGKSSKDDRKDSEPSVGDTDAELKRLQEKDPAEWTVFEVAKWLTFIGMGQYKNVFIENSISGAELFELETEDLASINVNKLGHRKKILKRIGMLKKNHHGAFKELSDDSSDSNLSSVSGSTLGSTAGSTSSKQHTGGGGGSTTTSASAVNTKSRARKPGSYAGDEVMFKCFVDDEVTVLRIKGKVTLSKLRKKLNAEHGKDMDVRFKDEDGDLLPIARQSHLKAAIKEAGGSAVRLYLSQRKKKAEADGFSVRDTQLLDNLVDPCIVIDKRCTVTFFNEAAEKLFGWSRHQVLGKNIKLLMPARTAAAHDGYVRNYLATGEGRIIGSGRTVIAQRRDKTTFPIHLSVSQFVQDKETCFAGVIKDLSTFKTVSNASSSSSSSSSAEEEDVDFLLLDGILDAAIVITDTGTVLFFNKAAEKLLGLQRSDVLGRNVKMLMPSPFRDEHDQYLRNYITTGVPKVIGTGRDVIAECKDGSIIPVNLSLTETGIDGMRRFTGILRPIKDEIAHEKTILQQEREVLDHLLVPAIVIDHKATIHAFNQPACQLFGYSLIEVVGKNIKMLMPNPDRDRHDQYVEAYLQTGQSRVLGSGRDVVALHKDGSMIPVHLSVTERKDGEKRYFTGIVQKL